MCVNCLLLKFNKNTELPKIKIVLKNILDPKIAYQITSMMEGVVKKRYCKKFKKILNVPLSWKNRNN